MTARKQLCKSCIRSLFPESHPFSVLFPLYSRPVFSSKCRTLTSISRRSRYHAGLSEARDDTFLPSFPEGHILSVSKPDGLKANSIRGVDNSQQNSQTPSHYPSSGGNGFIEKPLSLQEKFRRQPNEFPDSSDYSSLPIYLFTSTSGSATKDLFHQYAPEDLEIETKIEFLYQTEGSLWRQEITINIPASGPVIVRGDGLTADQAVLNSYHNLIALLHKRGILSTFQLSTTFQHTPPLLDSQFGKLQVYNYAARFGLVPTFSVHVQDSPIESSRRKKKRKLFSVLISLPSHNLSISGEAFCLSTAELIAVSRFRTEVERSRSKGNHPKLDLRDNAFLNIDTASGFLSFYSTQHANINFRYRASEVPFGAESFWSTQVLLNEQICGSPVLMQDAEASKVAANLTAALELSQSHPELLEKYLQVLETGKGAMTRPFVPVKLSLDLDTVEQLKDIIYDAEVKAKTHPIRISQQDLFKSFARLRPASTLQQFTRLRSSKTFNPSLPRDLSPQRSQFPVFQRATEITDTINSHIFSIVIGSTGSGKSTQIPQILLDDAIRRGELGSFNLCCTQPKRISAQALAHRVAFERGEQVGDSVGYRVSNERILPRTDGGITYSTAEVLQLQLGYSWDSIFDHFSHILIDEVHERDAPTDALLATLKLVVDARLASGKHVPRIVLMSATIHTDLFKKYFTLLDPETGKTVPCPVLEIHGRMHPVEKKSLNQVLSDLNNKMQDPSLQAILSHPSHSRYLEIERRLVEGRSQESPLVNWKSQWELSQEREEWHMSFSLVAATIANICASTKEGAILVFLPGIKEMKIVQNLLHSRKIFGLDFRDDSQFHFLLLHSANPEALTQVMNPLAPGVRKIILSTNIAESSITVPDVRYVIDSGKNRTPIFDHARQLTKVTRTWASQASVIQRAGRAGRVQAGVYHALFTSMRAEQMESLSQKHSIRQTRLQKVCLRIKEQFPELPLEEYFQKTIDPPSQKEIDAAVRDLRAIGAFTSDLELTYLGRVLAKFPGQPTVGRMILLGALFRCLEPMIIIGAAMSSSKSLFVQPEKSQDRIRASAIRFIYAQGSGSDHVAAAFAYKELRTILEREGAQAAEQWADDSFLNIAAFYDIMNFYKKVEVTLSRHLNIHRVSTRQWNLHASNMEVIKAVAFGGLYPNVGVHVEEDVFQTSAGTDSILSKHSTLLMSVSKLLEDYSSESGFPHPLSDTVCCYSDLSLGMVGERGLLRGVSPVSPLVAALFGGQLKVDELRVRAEADDLDKKKVQNLLMGGWLPLRVETGEGIGDSSFSGASAPSTSPTDAIQTFIRFKAAWDRLLSQILETMSLDGVKRQILSRSSLQRTFIDGIIHLISPDLPRRPSERGLLEQKSEEVDEGQYYSADDEAVQGTAAEN